MVVASLENGGNVDFVCRETRICKTGIEHTSVRKEAYLFNYAMAFCTELHRPKSNVFKYVSFVLLQQFLWFPLICQDFTEVKGQ